jgi:hypothetical protein
MSMPRRWQCQTEVGGDSGDAEQVCPYIIDIRTQKQNFIPSNYLAQLEGAAICCDPDLKMKAHIHDSPISEKLGLGKLRLFTNH